MESQMRQRTIEALEDRLNTILLTLANSEALISEIETLEEAFDSVSDEIKDVGGSESLASTISSVVDTSDVVEDEIEELKEMVETIRVALNELRS